MDSYESPGTKTSKCPKTVRIIKWQPRKGKRRQDRRRARCRGDIEGYTGITWNRQAADRDEWRKLAEIFVLQWTHRDC